jgi:hypothetical protein
MSDEPKRRWLQFSLQTAIALSFILGGLIWANMQEEEFETDEVTPESIYYVGQGWPLNVYILKEWRNPGYRFPEAPHHWEIASLFADIFISLALLVVAALVCERWKWRTKIVLVLSACGMLWLNMSPRERAAKDVPDISENYGDWVSRVVISQFGWPFHQFRWSIISAEQHEYVHWSTDNDLHTRDDPDRWVMKVNFFIALALLLGVGGACEYLLRRREGRKP